MEAPVNAPEPATAIDADELTEKVKRMYRDVARHPGADYHFELGRGLAERLGYPVDALDRIPTGAVDSFAGVGYFFDLADLSEGEHVIDFGSGSGMDTFVAAQHVGWTGRVVGIDMTKEQLTKASALARSAHVPNLWYLKAYLEDVPCVDESFDAAISNGVFNLAADKRAAFREVARVLRSGGRMAISDIVSEAQLPLSITCDTTYWASCIGGAMQIDDYVAAIEASGLRVQTVRDNPEYRFLSRGAAGAMDAHGVKSISLLAAKP